MKPKLISAGLAIRNQIRRYLLSQGRDFKEDKGLFTSDFYLSCSDDVFAQVCEMLSEAYPNTVYRR